MKAIMMALALLLLACRGGNEKACVPDFSLIATSVVPSVVRIEPSGGMSQRSGSGFVVPGRDGHPLVITNHHVVWGARVVAIKLSNGMRLDATVVGVDPAADIAVLRARADTPLTPLVLGDDASLRIGDWVAAVGWPSGVPDAVSVGVVSARTVLAEASSPAQRAVAHLFTDAVISPGSSGGPIVDGQGRVVGVATAEVGETRGLGLVIPIRLVAAIQAVLAAGAQFAHSDAGLTVVMDAAPPRGEPFVRVVSVEPGRAAAAAGLQPGDHILAIDGRPLRDASELTWHEFMDPPGTRWRLSLARGDRQLPIELSLEPLGP